MARRSKSLMDAGEAHRFMFGVVHRETAHLLEVVDELCRRYPPNNDLQFVRYLLRMVVLETQKDGSKDGRV